MKDPKFRTLQSLLSFIALICLLIIASCGGDDDPTPTPKSSAKSILTFKFSGLSPEVTGTITEADKKISVTLPAGTDVTALVPTITVSEKATVSPASGAAQNFTNAVNYTVTAEDGSTQVYAVTVTVSMPLSSAKSITSFTFGAFDPTVVGTINESEKTITAMVPNGTDVSSLAPTIVVSEKATVSPASNAEQNFTNAVTYTVTAEDGTTAEYDVTVTVNPNVDFTLDDYTGPLELAQGVNLELTGDNFGNYMNNGIVMINEFESEFTLYASETSTDELLVVNIPSDMAAGEYHIKVFIGSQSLMLEETFTVVVNDAVITSVTPNPIVRGEDLTINGNYFTFNFEVYLVDDADGATLLDVVENDYTHIVVTIPAETTPDDSYRIRVRQNNVDVDFGPIEVQVQPGIPFISEINDFSFTRGETMIFTGVNLKKVGAVTNINFMPFLGGTTLVRSATSVNAEGTEVTFNIPNDFPTGSYSILIEVDFEFSDEYRDVIVIE